MSIKVTCPNGHALQVKSEFAGKSGLCPHCKARIIVPRSEPEPVSEDDLLEVLGPPRVVHHVAVPSDPSPHHHPAVSKEGMVKEEPKKQEPKKEGAAIPAGSALLRRKKVCPKCCEIISVTHSDCPRCHTPLSEWTFPLPDENTMEEGRRPSCHYLGLRKQGNVIVIRFGEHRILDEITVKKFGDELFHVAERTDCHNVLLNFFGVVGLSSAMLGIMLMLRKKISQKSGKIKLCQVGPEIMDVFHATKLGQLFEILGSEQQGLKAFA
ncbi:MAG: STAS domain-containing protein [Thermoguttaceae bacterium]